jgi:hypothetical protein
MATVDFSSFKEIIVPPIYVEQITVHDATVVSIGTNNASGRRFTDRTGKTNYSVATGASQQNLNNKNVIDLEADLFFMIDDPTFEVVKAKPNISVYALAVEDESIINYIKNGGFTFGKIESLIAEGRIKSNTLGIKNFFENEQTIEDDAGNTFHKLNSKIKIQIEQNPNLVCFFFAVLEHGFASSIVRLSDEGNIYGRMIGEVVFDNGQIPDNFYYFHTPEQTVWAGPVFHKEVGSSTVYKQGLKEITGSENRVTRQVSKTPKIIDVRRKNTKNLFRRAVDSFFEKRGSLNKTNRTNRTSSGISPIFSSLVKNKDTTSATSISHVSNTIFLNVLQNLRDNSIYSFLLEGLEQQELLAIVSDTFIRNIKIHRTPIKKNKNDKSAVIINSSFMPGSPKFQASTVTTTDFNLTSDSRNVNFIYLEEEQNNNYGPAFRDYRVITFVDNVDSYFTKSSFYYKVEISFEDGIIVYGTKKLEAFKQSVEKVKFAHSQMLSPTFIDSEGAFTDTARRSGIDDEIALLLSDLIETLSFFFKFQKTELSKIYQTLYAITNTKTGNLESFEEMVALFEHIYLFLVNNLDFAQQETIAVPDSTKTAGKKKNKFFEVTKNSNIIDMSLERTFGVNYQPADNSFFKMGNNLVAPVYAPSVTFSTLNKAITEEAKFYEIKGDFTKVEDRFTHHRPFYVHNGKDYDIREQHINIKEKKGSAMKNYYSSLFNKVSLKTSFGGHVSDLDYDLSEDKETKNISNINLDYTKRREMLTSISGLNTTIEPKLAKTKLRSGELKPKDTTLFDAQSETKQSSITQNIDINTSDLEMNFMSIIEAASSVGKSQKNTHAIVDKKATPYQLQNLPKGNRRRARDTSQDFFKFSMLVKFRTLVGFESVSMTPIFNDGTKESDIKIGSLAGKKIFCKVEKIKSSLIKSPKNKEMTGKLMNEFFVVFDSDKEVLDFEQIIDNTPVVARRNVVAASISESLLQNQLSQNNRVYDQQEKIFSNSIYVEQPKETKETRFDFLAKRPTQPTGRPSTITVVPVNRIQTPSGGF